MTAFDEVGMEGQHRQLARVRKMVSSATCLSWRFTSRCRLPERWWRDKSLGLLSARCRASQAPCWAFVPFRRSARKCSGTSDDGSVEEMSSRELKSRFSSTGFCTGVWTAGEIRRTRWTSGWKERTRSIISSLDRRTLLFFLSRRRDELLTHMDRYCCASVILKNRYVSSCLAKKMSEMPDHTCLDNRG